MLGPELRLYLLGTFRLERDKREIILPRRKLQALLAYLALYPEPHAREKLAALFWGDASDDAARSSLRNEISTLRRLVAPDLVLADRETIQLNPDAQLWTDAKAIFDFRFSSADFNSQAQTESIESRNWKIENYSDLLADFYDDWILQLREQLRAQYIATLHTLIQAARSQSEYPRAIAYAQRLLQTDRADERAHQHLIFCFVSSGDRARALKQYEECVTALREELSVEPSDETVALYEWVKQTSSSTRSLAARRTNLPIPLTSLIGRQRETAEIKQLLRGRERDTKSAQRPIPLVTLTGAGGSGKTRLAIQVGTDLVDAYRDGVWWVELAPLANSELVPHAVAQALGVKEQANETLLTTLANVLRERQVLLLLDNCEHLVDVCAQVAQTLLTQCPQLQILATSREGLNVPGEVTWLVPLLGVPTDGGQLTADVRVTQDVSGEFANLAMSFESVRLFVERAFASNSAFQLNNANVNAVIEICRRLDGIPLAIELAAARVKTLPVEQIAARLHDRFGLLTTGARTVMPRQQTLRALIDWSYDLLPQEERALFRRLSVFAGGWTVEAMEYVCQADTEVERAQPLLFDTLAHLVEKSLVVLEERDGTARYRYLETMREYAREKLTAANEYAHIAAKHLAYLEALSIEATTRMFGQEQLVWLNRFEAERDNVRAALEFGLAQSDTTRAVRIAGNLVPFWQLRNYWSEGRDWSERALAKMDETQDAEIRAKALGGAGVLAWLQGDYATALPRHERARELFGQAGNKWGVANSTINIGLQYSALGRYAEAWDLYQAALAQARELKHSRLTLRALNNLCSVAGARGQSQAHLDYFQEALTLAREVGDKYSMAIASSNMAQAMYASQNWAGSLEHTTEVLTHARALSNQEFSAFALRLRGLVFLKQGKLADAQHDIHSSLELAVALKGKRPIVWAMEALAMLRAAQTRFAEATMLAAYAAAVRAQVGLRLEHQEQIEQHELLAQLRAQLGEMEFERLREQGQTLSLEQAANLAWQDEPPR